MKKLLSACWLVGLLFSCNVLQAQLTAFPGAEGAGKFVRGGRGTLSVAPTVLEVTTLDDNSSSANTPGTLRYACTRSGFANRIIVFRVSGTIRLFAPLTLNRANTTIAGQTAPGEGICIADHPVRVSANNIIIRYLRFRLGDRNQAATNGNDDAISGTGVRNLIIDHCSVSWSNDEAFTFYSGDSTTLQWNLISEPLDYSFHDEGDGIQNHGYGGIWGGRRASFHHNLIAHCRGRMPRFDGIRNISTDTGDFRNNVIYNWASYNTNGGEGGTYNIVGNYYKWGPSTPNNSTAGVNRRSMILHPFEQSSPPLPYGRFFLDGNFSDNSTLVSAFNWRGVAFEGGSLADSATQRVQQPFRHVPVNTQSAQDAYRDVLLLAGCSLPNRDTLDARIVRDVENRTGRLIDVQGGYPRGTPFSVSQNAWPALAQGTRQTDSDQDGMPDNWELARGLNPQLASDRNGYISTSGYSNLENYINGDTIAAAGRNNECMNAKSLFCNGSDTWRWARDSSFYYYLSESYTCAADSNHVVAGVLDDVPYGRISVSFYTTSQTRIHPVTGRAYLGRNITLAPANSLAQPMIVRFYFTSAQFNALRAADASIQSPADLVVMRSPDLNCPDALPATFTVIEPFDRGVFGTYSNGYYVEFETEAGGSFFIGGSLSFPVPLRLLDFRATSRGRTAELSWTTGHETGQSRFILERSLTGIRFTPLATLYSRGTEGTHTYQYTDELPAGPVTYYRLRVQDADGSYFYSPVRIIRNITGLVQIQPNPVSDQLRVQFPPATGGTWLQVFGTDGRLYIRRSVPAGALSMVLSVKDLPKGAYLLRIDNGNQQAARSFIKQ